MDNNRLIGTLFHERKEAVNRLVSSDSIIDRCSEIADIIVDCFEDGGKIMFCGNGGSAADAQHLAAELSGRFYIDRKALPAEALHVNSSFMTAVANDFSFAEVYSRIIEGTGKKGDILVALSTSGNSENIIKAVKTANILGITTIGFTGEDGGLLKEVARMTVRFPSDDTAVIQEMHMTAGHIICEVVEKIMFGNE